MDHADGNMMVIEQDDVELAKNKMLTRSDLIVHLHR